MQGYVFELKNHPGTSPDARIIYTGPRPDRIELTGDFFRFYAGNRVSSGVIADAANLLLDGDFEIESTPEYESAQSGTRFVVAGKGFLCKDLLAADLDRLVSERTAFLRDAPIPPDVSES